MTADTQAVTETITYAGSFAACGGVVGYLNNENAVLLIISIVGAFVSVFGLLYSIWSNERSYRLRLKELDRQHLLARIREEIGSNDS